MCKYFFRSLDHQPTMLVKHNMSAPNAIYKNKNDPSMKVTFRDLKRYEDYKSKIKNFVVCIFFDYLPIFYFDSVDKYLTYSTNIRQISLLCLSFHRIMKLSMFSCLAIYPELFKGSSRI